MQSLIEDLQAYEFIFANAPDDGGLWIQDPPGGKGEPTTDPDWAAESISYLNEFVTNNGPFHGILGYSQGSAMATVFLASSNHAFEKVLLFNGYLPSTHEGLIQTINDAQLGAHDALVFAGSNDTIINSQLSQELSTKFDSPTFVLSDEAGHHLPEAADPTYSQITDFLAINSTPHDEDPNSTDDPNDSADPNDPDDGGDLGPVDGGNPDDGGDLDPVDGENPVEEDEESERGDPQFHILPVGEPLTEGPLAGAIPFAEGWFYSPWFGVFSMDSSRTDPNWVYHIQLGWIYLSDGSAENAWIWSENLELGWFWTNRNFISLKDDSMGWSAANLYRSTDSAWLYYMPDEDRESRRHQGNLLYNYNTGQWHSTE
jgi:hypothetical protein